MLDKLACLLLSDDKFSELWHRTEEAVQAAVQNKKHQVDVSYLPGYPIREVIAQLERIGFVILSLQKNTISISWKA